MKLTSDILLVYFKEKLYVDTSGIDLETKLFSSGLIDSFSMVELILFMEESCKTKIKPSEINLNNLDSIDRILNFMDKKIVEIDC